MNGKKKTRKRRWSLVFLWVGLIYSTLSMVRPFCGWLKQTTPFSLLVNLFLITVFVLIMARLFCQLRRMSLSAYLLLTLLIVIYGLGFIVLKYPEERIHFLEYGLLAYLIFDSLRIDCLHKLAFLLAFVLTTALGWIDEGIQFMLPNRYYQTQDVILNSVSGLMGLFLTAIYIDVKGRERRSH